MTYKDGKLEGLYEEFHENGQLTETRAYKDGIEQNRTVFTYHENGQLKSRGNVKDGNMDGLWEWFDEDGQLETRGNLKDGELLDVSPKD